MTLRTHMPLITLITLQTLFTLVTSPITLITLIALINLITLITLITVVLTLIALVHQVRAPLEPSASLYMHARTCTHRETHQQATCVVCSPLALGVKEVSFRTAGIRH